MNRSPRSTVRAPRRFRPIALVAMVAIALAAAPLAFAQDAPARIEQQMTAEQFRAAGLDQLDAGQLANLNAWLNRTLDAETGRAAQQAAEQARQEAHAGDGERSGGFLDFGSEEPVAARLQGRFDGFARGREYTLDNGQVWRQIDDASLTSVQLDHPQVMIDKALFGSAWYLRVEGYNTRAKVERVR